MAADRGRTVGFSDNSELVAVMCETFLEGLDLHPDTAVTTLEFGQHPHWDSLGHMTLVAAIENRFSVTLDGDEVMRLNSFAAAIEIFVARKVL